MTFQFISLHNPEKTTPWASTEHNSIKVLILLIFLSHKNDTRRKKMNYIFKTSATKLIESTYIHS